MADFLTDAEMAALEAQQGGSAPGFISDADMDALETSQSAAATGGWSAQNLSAAIDKNILTPGAQVAQGAFANFADEASAGIGAFANKGIDVVSALAGYPTDLTQGATLGQAYDDYLSQIRGQDKAFQTESPITSALLNVGGAVASPINKLVPSTYFSTAKGVAPAIENIIKGSGLGGIYGAGYGFGAGEGGLENRLETAKQGGGIGMLTGGVLQSLAEGGQGLINAGRSGFESFANSLNRRSIGARASDYAKTAKDLNVFDIKDAEVASRTSRALDNLIKDGALGSTREGPKMLANILTKEQDLNRQVGELISAVDDSGVKAVPSFENAIKYIEQGKVPANKVGKYRKEIKSLADSIEEEGKGSLSYLQQQKIAAGDKYVPDDGAANGFWRAVYTDLQRTVEKHVPEVRGLNKTLSEIKLAKPILQRNLGSAENRNFLDSIRDLIRTSGGTLTTPTILGGALGAAGGGLAASVGAPLGLLGGAALGIASSRAGQQKIANSLLSLAHSDPRALANLAPALTRGTIPLSGIGPKSPESKDTKLSSPQSLAAGLDRSQAAKGGTPQISAPKSLKAPEQLSLKRIEPNAYAQTAKALAPAVTKIESEGKPKALSSKGAIGLMQLRPKTAAEVAKRLKIRDPDLTDPKTNVALGTAYLEQMLQEFKGNVPLALAAYNAGPNRVRSWITAYGPSWETISRNLKRKGSYIETVKYVPKVLDNFGVLRA